MCIIFHRISQRTKSSCIAKENIESPIHIDYTLKRLPKGVTPTHMCAALRRQAS